MVVLFFITGCNSFDQDQINTGNTLSEISYEGLPVILVNTDHQINNKVKVNCRIDVMGKGSVVREKIFGKIKFRDGDFYGKEPKKSFSIALFKEDSPGSLPARNEWLLLSSYIDKTFLRDIFAYYLFGQMDHDHILAQTEFVELYINGNYSGLYILTGKLNEKDFNIDLQDKSSFLCKEPQIFLKDSKIFNQIYPPQRVKDHTTNLAKLKGLFFNSTDKEFFNQSNGIFEFCDKKNLINWHLLLMFTGNSGGYTKDFYLFKRSNDAKFMYTIWDYDYSFGRTWDGQPDSSGITTKGNILFKRLIECDSVGYKDEIKEMWSDYSNGIFADYRIIGFIDSIAGLLKPFVPKNETLYPFDGPLYYSKATFEEEILMLKQEIRRRKHLMDKYFNVR
ncbi:MAG: CotH kinase family protein [Bacteroidales bacterium]|nr:CotH kinase family protein [Bacteroidales bacterium]